MGRSIDTRTVIAKFTYFGDGNLDGKVTGDDYVAVDANLGLSNAQWFQGDFNFSNTTTGDDYVAIDANLGAGTSAPLAVASEAPATLLFAAKSEPVADTDVQPLEVQVVAT